MESEDTVILLSVSKTADVTSLFLEFYAIRHPVKNIKYDMRPQLVCGARVGGGGLCVTSLEGYILESLFNYHLIDPIFYNKQFIYKNSSLEIFFLFDFCCFCFSGHSLHLLYFFDLFVLLVSSILYTSSVPY